MHGTLDVRKTRRNPRSEEKIKAEFQIVTPAMATEWLEQNTENRPISTLHVMMLAEQIRSGQWVLNGETIKFSDAGTLIDGQHRLWAIIEANRPVPLMVVAGVSRSAFATIDTLSRARTPGDVVALNGAARYRNVTASALSWLLRWQRGIVPDYRAPENKITNADVEAMIRSHPEIVRAVERAMKLRRLANVSVMAFIYYVVANRNPDLAERMMDTLENPKRISVNDPFFRLRTYFTNNHHMKKDPVVTIALAIKAANAASRNRPLTVLRWSPNGKSGEAFPILSLKGGR